MSNSIYCAYIRNAEAIDSIYILLLAYLNLILKKMLSNL